MANVDFFLRGDVGAGGHRGVRRGLSPMPLRSFLRQKPISNENLYIGLRHLSAAGGQETVWIRFRWVGTWGYLGKLTTSRCTTRLASMCASTTTQAPPTTSKQVGTKTAHGHCLKSIVPRGWSQGLQRGIRGPTNVAIDLDVNGTVYTSDTIDVLAYQANDTLRMPYHRQ